MIQVEPDVGPGAFLQDKVVGEIEGSFFVARYQRGYRWTEPEVLCLLRDLHDNVGKPYCLQPVVVQARGDGEWELVDGQQRLTTLYLLFRYLRDSGLKPMIELDYRITYETRAKSAEYLDSLDAERRVENIDFHHLHRAYQCIRGWFEQFPPNRRQMVADDIFGSLMRHVRIIWYVAPRDLDPTALFTRLNVGRIPLDDAELFKALLLSAVSAESGTADRATEVAAQWDAIERDLRDPDIWAFISSRPAETRPTRITLLLEVLVGQAIDNTPGSFRVFDALRQRLEESDCPQDVWNDVVGLHATVMGWFRSRDLYHKIGYLITVGWSVAELVHLARKLTKREFEAKLDDRIRQALNLTPSEAANLSYERAGDWTKAERLLLLMNVETVRRNRHSTERYPFRSHKAHAWSLEHIHAQHAQSLNKAEQWREWLCLHRDVLETLPVTEPERLATRDRLLDRLRNLPTEIAGATFNDLAAEVQAFFSLAEEGAGAAMHSVHSISNLALLPSGANSALSNAVFEVKRQKVIEMDRHGAYIPVCTRHVFLKYFTGADAQQVHFWSLLDRESYLDAMIGSVGGADSTSSGIVRHYLKPEEHLG
ncbi:GmrSD restriction endonuclease domain-containing protein [Cupriavidus consociatus]|uniref:GmrSD restriction endonuclease domain-containing protein n=1 Tax=Cupriavidus consociatus TaxID=2821357 RepID=UPI001AE8B532|nr:MULTISPECIES: DUF262 domain-containing protein [unclassified Cupriavidus]MBP0622884.1 DUF262 domain-containing protein [Cupriavidus sp. LEh25]MDK2659570.1 DUF262 domain-containing protein [Cupriavidus sp. LEh21]